MTPEEQKRAMEPLNAQALAAQKASLEYRRQELQSQRDNASAPNGAPYYVPTPNANSTEGNPRNNTWDDGSARSDADHKSAERMRAAENAANQARWDRNAADDQRFRDQKEAELRRYQQEQAEQRRRDEDERRRRGG